tara:strand:+ start:64 stop:261 length:198 start_codon:yes stop_codon:yes gene_type:complete
MAYEDLFWEITLEVEELGIRDKFDAQLEKMKHQEKHQYKDVRDKWDYAFQKVKKIHLNEKDNESI